MFYLSLRVCVTLLVREQRLWRAQLPSMGVKTSQHTGREAARISSSAAASRLKQKQRGAIVGAQVLNTN